MKGIKKLKTGFISRQISMAKIAIKTGSSFLLSGDKDLKDKLKSGLEGHLDQVVEELGVMKGSIMKAGQSLSTYAGAFLPEEARQVLKALENQSHFLDWDVLKKRVPKEWLAELNIDPIPIAAASLGQVHRAVPKEGGETFVMKVQYEGVKKAIDNDVKALKFLLNMMDLLPKDIDLSDVFEEVREMLYQETDYIKEAALTSEFEELTKNHHQFVVPKIITTYSNDFILSSSFVDGESVRSDFVKNLSQEKRNKLGEDFLRLFFLELFEWGRMQTDAHFGNYMVVGDDQWGLIDFGATKVLPEEFKINYQNLIISTAKRDKDLYFETVDKMGYLAKDQKSNRELLWEYAILLGEPYQNGIYDWGASPIPDQVFKYAPRLFKEISIGKPPRDAVFVDRKVGGVFFMLKELGAKVDSLKVLEEFLPPSQGNL